MQILQELVQKGKSLAKNKDFLTFSLILLVAIGSFGLGRLSVLDLRTSPIRVELPPQSGITGQEAAPIAAAGAGEGQAQGKLVGSINSTKYHFPWCSGAQRIKEDNKVWFASAQDARARGYTPAANCPGLE